MSTFITCSDLTFAWPDGRVVFDGLSLVVGTGRSGLVGVNGSGKSTLLRLIAGELVPARGSVRVAGELGYLPQDITLAADLRVDEVLGIAGVLDALYAVERGDVTQERLDVLGDNWGVEEAATATLARLGLGHVALDRRVRTLSGGEAVLLALVAQLLREPDVLVLDEPTNNLDLDARRRLYAAVEAWPGVLLVVSHDRELLDRVDQIADLRAGSVRWYGGNLSAYEEAVAAEQEAAERAVRMAESDVRRQQRELTDARIKLDRRQRYGRTMWESKRQPKIVMGARKRQAQVSAGKHRAVQLDRLERAREQLTGAEQVVRDDDEIRVDLPGAILPAGRTVLTLDRVRPRYGPEVSLSVRGPERIALVGGNGTGKTTLLRTIAGSLDPLAGSVRCDVPVRHLPQCLDVLDDALTLVENVARLAPEVPPGDIRARLARFEFRGSQADQQAATLSGGERFRASLAALLLAAPAPQLLLLDEPTNNLDLASVRQLVQALRSFQGALIAASHDVPFLRDITPTRWVRVDVQGLTEIDPI